MRQHPDPERESAYADAMVDALGIGGETAEQAEHARPSYGPGSPPDDFHKSPPERGDDPVRQTALGGRANHESSTTGSTMNQKHQSSPEGLSIPAMGPVSSLQTEGGAGNFGSENSFADAARAKKVAALVAVFREKGLTADQVYRMTGDGWLHYDACAKLRHTSSLQTRALVVAELRKLELDK